MPACLVCISSKRSCTYDNSSRKRGLQTGYVRGLETLLGLFLREAPQEAYKIRTSLRSQDTSGWAHGDAFTEGATDVWRKSGLLRDLERLLATSEDAPESPPESLSPLSSPDFDIEQSRHAPSVPEGSEKPRQVSRIPAEDLGSVNDICEQKLPSHTSDMVDFYFTYIHCWFPLLERRDILRTLYSDTPAPGLPSASKGPKLCLWAIILLVTAQKRMQTDVGPAPNQILNALLRQINQHDQDPDLGYIQAALIIVMVRAGWSHFQAAWVLVGQAARMLLVHQQHSPRYTHTLLGCLMLDNFLSALLRKRSYFSPSDQLLAGPLSEDSLEEWELWNPPSGWIGAEMVNAKRPVRAISTFNLMSHLMERLTRMNLSSPDATRYEDAVHDLQSWKANLPDHYQLQEMSAWNPALLNLHLMWNFVMCFLLTKTPRADANILHLATQTAGSTVDILGKICAEVGANSPFLLGYSLQAYNCLKTVTQVLPDDAASFLLMRLEAIQDVLGQSWKNLSHESPSTVENIQGDLQRGPADAESLSLPNTAQSVPANHGMASGLDPSLTAPFEPRSPNDMHGTLRRDPRVSSELRPFELDRSSEKHTLSGIDPFHDINDFDTLLQEMPFLVPVERPSPPPDFALNLGFVGDELDPDFLGYLRPGGKPQDSESLPPRGAI